MLRPFCSAHLDISAAIAETELIRSVVNIMSFFIGSFLILMVVVIFRWDRIKLVPLTV